MTRKRIVGVAMLAMTLGACAHAPASRAAQPSQAASTSYRSIFLASTSDAQPSTGGQVIVEHADCDPWARAQAQVCSVETMLESSIP